MKYKIVSITHSGRKGVRGTDVTASKYLGITGSIVTMKKIEDIKQFDMVHCDFIETESPYEYLDTSEVLSIWIDRDNRYHIETVNSIYVLEKVE